MKGTKEQSPPETTRRRRLEAIRAEWPGTEPPPEGEVPRFVALTSEGPPESSPGPAPTLVLAEERSVIAERLRAEIAEGRLAHGRIWDLDAAFYPWGNLALAYEVRVGEEPVRPVHAVSVEGADGGLYLFADRLDADAFCLAVRRRDGRARVSEERLYDNSGADRLIDAQREALLEATRGD
jgi:hypothetical protein